jgi:hypothetical protein
LFTTLLKSPFNRTTLDTPEISGLVLTKRSDQQASPQFSGYLTYEDAESGQSNRGFDSPHPLFDLVKLSLDYPASSV